MTPSDLTYDEILEMKRQMLLAIDRLPPRFYYFDSIEEAQSIEATFIVGPKLAEKKCGCGTGTMSPKHADYCDLYAPED